MFEQVTILLSFVYAIALTHLLSSAHELVLERRRVRFSWLYALWMLNALIILIENWLGFWGLHLIRQWTIGQILLQLSLAIVQYFTCSLLMIRPKDTGAIDMVSLFEERRTAVACAFFAMWFVAMAMNYFDRDVLFEPQTSQWILADAELLPASLFIALAGWARPRRLQWLGGIGVFLVAGQFLVVGALGPTFGPKSVTADDTHPASTPTR